MCAASYWPCKRLGLLRLLRGGIAAFLGERKVKNAFLLLLLLLASALFPAENFSSSFKMQFTMYVMCFRLDHPNVVKLLEAYESKSYVYLVMEL